MSYNIVILALILTCMTSGTAHISGGYTDAGTFIATGFVWFVLIHLFNAVVNKSNGAGELQ